MWAILFWIVGCYAMAAMAVHIAAKRRSGLRAAAHYVLLADNEAERIEWYLRRLRRWSCRSGRDVRVTVVGCGTDETAAIADRFARRSESVTVVRPGEAETGGEAAEAVGEAKAAADSVTGSTAAEVDGNRESAIGAKRNKERWKRIQSDRRRESDEPFWWRIDDASYGGPGRAVLVDLSDPADVALLP